MALIQVEYGGASTPLASNRERRSATASAIIYRSLRFEILRVKRRPGDPIVEKQIAHIFGVSRTPVREAMLKLADERLVDIFPQSGTFVARIPVDELPECMEIRRVLEDGAVRRAALNVTDAAVAAMRRSIVHQQAAIDAADREAFHEADEDLHRLLAVASGFPRLWDVTQNVKMHIDRFRLLALPEPGRMQRVLREHQSIVAAVAARDPSRAVEAMDTHLDSLRENLTLLLETVPDYFTSGVARGGQ